MSTASAPRPSEIRRDPASRTLSIVWEDGTSTVYDYDVLRGYCPCAGCQGHMVRELRYHPPRRPVDPVAIEPVGHYGISILWSDAHNTGIYRFDLLHRLKPLIEKGGPVLV